MTAAFDFIFMADCQLGAYATFSGMTEADIERFEARDMRVEVVPQVEGFTWDAERYSEAVTAANALRPAFVVMGGDMIDDSESQEQYDAVMTITSDLDDEITMHWVPGNHDIADDTVVPTPARIAKYREAFGADYYSFDHGDVRFIVLNTVVIDHPEDSGDALAVGTGLGGGQGRAAARRAARLLPGRGRRLGALPRHPRTAEAA